MIAFLRAHLADSVEILLGMTAGCVIIAGAWMIWPPAERDTSLILPAEPEGCPLVASFDGYTEHARALIGRDESRKAYPRTVRIYTAPDGSWLIAYDPIGTGEYACIADQGVKFEVQVTGGTR